MQRGAGRCFNRIGRSLRLWNNGEPIKQGDEFKNPVKYQERVAQLRMALLRSEADMAGLRRELARLGTVVAKP